MASCQGNECSGKRIASQQGSTNAKIIREKMPTAQLREFPDQPAAFQALIQGQVDAYTNDGIQLWGLKAKAPNAADWEIVGDFYSEEPWPCGRATPSSSRRSTPA